jgi:hypothetical protein
MSNSVYITGGPGSGKSVVVLGDMELLARRGRKIGFFRLAGGRANFSLFFRPATRVESLFFDRADDANPSRRGLGYPEGDIFGYLMQVIKS